MPRKYSRTSTRQDWDVEQMKKAIMSVSEGTFGYLKASLVYGVPKSTLQDRVRKYRQKNDLTGSTQKGLGRFKAVFSTDQEATLVQHILLMEQRLFGLSYKDLRVLAYQLAVANGIHHNFNKDRKEAGEDWLSCFMKRHPELSLRAAERTSIARAIGFNKVSVGKFFDLLEGLMDQHKFPPTRIFNVDETGLTTVPKRQSRVIALKGKKQVGLVSSAERGQLTTAVLCMSASGYYLPPLLIFPRVRMKPELLDGAPPGTIAVCHQSGWIQSEIFVQWLDHLISSVKPTKENPVLLLLDGHSTHTKNLPLIMKARDNGVIMLSFPPHCTHRLQPLDVSFIGPLSTYYTQEVNTFLRNNPGRIVTQFQLSRLFGAAYARAASLQNALSGFSKTGIYPTDRNVFSDTDFAAAETTEMVLQEENAIQSATINNIPSTSSLHQSSFSLEPPVRSAFPVNLLSTTSCTSTPVELQTNSTSKMPCIIPMTPSGSRPVNSNYIVSPSDIMPVPRVENSTKRITRRRGKTAIITSSPFKEELQSNSQSKIKKPKLNLSERYGKKKDKGKMKSNTQDSQDICAYCLEKYGHSRMDEGWVQCTYCKGWAHEGCTGYDSDDLDDFLCTKCMV